MPAVGIFQQQTHPAHATAEDVEHAQSKQAEDGECEVARLGDGVPV